MPALPSYAVCVRNAEAQGGEGLLGFAGLVGWKVDETNAVPYSYLGHTGVRSHTMKVLSYIMSYPATSSSHLSQKVDTLVFLFRHATTTVLVLLFKHTYPAIHHWPTVVPPPLIQRPLHTCFSPTKQLLATYCSSSASTARFSRLTTMPAPSHPITLLALPDDILARILSLTFPSPPSPFQFSHYTPALSCSRLRKALLSSIHTISLGSHRRRCSHLASQSPPPPLLPAPPLPSLTSLTLHLCSPPRAIPVLHPPSLSLIGTTHLTDATVPAALVGHHTRALTLESHATAGGLTDAGLCHLLSLSPNLSSLTLRMWRLTPAGASAIAALPLTALTMRAMPGLSDQTFVTASALPSLQTLILSNAPAVGDSLALLACPYLHTLELRNCGLRAAGLAAIAQASPLLTRVSLTGCWALNDASGRALARLASLRDLEIINCALITPTVVADDIAAACPNLARLTLEFQDLTHGALGALGALQALQHLAHISLAYCKGVGAGAGDALAACRRLQTLSLVKTGVDDAGLDAIVAGAAAQRGSLRFVDVTQCPRVSGLAVLEARVLRRGALEVKSDFGNRRGENG